MNPLRSIIWRLEKRGLGWLKYITLSAAGLSLMGHIADPNATQVITAPVIAVSAPELLATHTAEKAAKLAADEAGNAGLLTILDDKMSVWWHRKLDELDQVVTDSVFMHEAKKTVQDVQKENPSLLADGIVQPQVMPADE